jgi:hypothetical protein
MELPKTTDRVPRHTAKDVNQKISAEAAERVASYGHDPEAIARRLDALDHEWDIERTLEANAATASLVGVVLGATVDRRFYALTAVVGAFLLQHALQGWCPPLPVFRRIGFRTQSEIEEERYALKAIRGDFANVRGGEHVTAEMALEVVRA